MNATDAGNGKANRIGVPTVGVAPQRETDAVAVESRESPPDEPRRLGGGKPARSGPPHNSNARTTGASIVRRERKELRRRAINGRTSEGRYVAEQRGDLVADLGGFESIATQERWIVEEASFLRLELAYVRTWLAEQPPFNRRKRCAHPILRDYLAMVNALRSLLADLGLKRRTRQVNDVDAWVDEDGARNDAPGSAHADAFDAEDEAQDGATGAE